MQLVTLTLRIAAEAGWISVVYAAACVLVSRHAPVLGPIELALFVAIGSLIGRWGRTRLELGALALIAAVLVAGALGWLASDDARSLLPSLPRALGVHLAGWLAGVAVVRGSMIGGPATAARELESSLRVVPVVLALVWAYTSLSVDAGLWLSFAVTALWGTVTYLAAALPAIGWARLGELHANLADDRRRRDWRWLVTAVGFCAVPVAVPVAILSGIPAEALLTPIAAPLQWLAVLISIPLSWIIWLMAELLRPFAGSIADDLAEFVRNRTRDVDPQSEQTPLAEVIGTTIAFVLVALTVLVVIIAIFLFARWLLYRGRQETGFDEAEADIERQIVVPAPRARARVARQWRLRRVPVRDVVTAYLGALRELEPHADYARAAAETPAQHATRVRRDGMPAAADMVRLAAGYQLARYGDRRMTSAEDQRALGRLERIRRALRR